MKAGKKASVKKTPKNKKGKVKKSPPKLAGVAARIREDATAGRFHELPHTQTRKEQRNIRRHDIQHVLKTGRREDRKDSYEDNHKSWNYSITGATVDERKVRVIVSFESNYMLIITVIELR